MERHAGAGAVAVLPPPRFPRRNAPGESALPALHPVVAALAAGPGAVAGAMDCPRNPMRGFILSERAAAGLVAGPPARWAAPHKASCFLLHAPGPRSACRLSDPP